MNAGASSPGRAPARLAPSFVKRPWGSLDLTSLFPKRPQEERPIGEAWLTGADSVFETGAFVGRTLGEIWPALPEEWTGTRLTGLPRIPLLVKFIFPEDKLSVQVHPDDVYAEQNETAAGGVGKTEMWYVVAGREGAEVRVGLRRNVTRKSFERAVVDGTVEDLLVPVPVSAGDAVFVPAGTVHTIWPGMVLCEIQEHSDITYRIFDYNRVGPDGKQRELHIRQALDVIRFGEQSRGLCDPVRITRGGVAKTFYAACRHFATERWEFSERIAAVTSPEHFDLLIVLEGEGRLEFADGSETYAPAEAWLLPAALGAYQLAPDQPDKPTALLRTYVPDLQGFVQRLTDDRVEEQAWSRVVHP